MDKNAILDYVTETPGNTNRAVLGDMLDSFGGEGGGDSDFSIVQVTLTVAEGKAELSIPVIFEQDGMAALVCETLYNGMSTRTVSTPLYKGMTVISIGSLSGNVTTTGACEYADDQLIITGDCTITIS